MDIESETQLSSANPALLVHLLVTRGFSKHQILSSTNVNPQLFDDYDSQISFSQYKQLIVNAIELTKNPAIGLEFGKRLNFTSSGLFSMGVMACKTFIEAMNLTKRIVTVLNPGVTITVNSDDDYLHLGIEEFLPWGNTGTFMVDVFFGFIATHTRVFDPNVSSKIIYRCKHDAIPNHEFYKEQLGSDVRFNSDIDQVSIPLEFCLRPLPFDNPMVVKQAEELLEKKIIELNNAHNTILHPIKQMIANSEGEALTLEDVAEAFHVSSRTLNRRLKNIGTSFKDVVTEVRHDRAVKYLKETNLSIEDIAHNLGYRDTSNFSKAFKVWTGLTPSGYRQRILK